MTFKRFEEIDAWKRASQLAVDIYRLTADKTLSKDFGLRDQMRRAAISISSNIAEGFERNSNPEFRRFLLIAKGSCGELRSQLMIVSMLGLASSEQLKSLIQECSELSSMLQGLITYLTSASKGKRR